LRRRNATSDANREGMIADPTGIDTLWNARIHGVGDRQRLTMGNGRVSASMARSHHVADNKPVLRAPAAL